MHDLHEANRRKWNAAADRRHQKYEPAWGRRLLKEPGLAFRPVAHWLAEYVGDLQGKRACVLGSGDNHAVIALAALGARVTSVDISHRQLAIAREKVADLGLEGIEFVQADVTELPLPAGTYDFACSIGVVAIWIADLVQYYREAYRILKPGGHFMGTESHPLRRLVTASESELHCESHYFDQRPQKYRYREEDADGNVVEGDQYEFTWKVSDYVNAQLRAGLTLVALEETPHHDLDRWREDPEAALPHGLAFLSRKLKPRA